jgi:hypothetical protein
MTTDTKAKAKAEAVKRAAMLREQIERLKQTPDGTEKESSGRPLSPREFVHKRMAELDKKK